MKKPGCVEETANNLLAPNMVVFAMARMGEYAEITCNVARYL